MSVDPSFGFAYLRQFLQWQNRPDGASVRSVDFTDLPGEQDLIRGFLSAGIVNANIPAIMGVLREHVQEWTEVGKPFEFRDDVPNVVAVVEKEGLVAKVLIQYELMAEQGRVGTVEEICQILLRHDVSFGVDREKIAQILENPIEDFVAVAHGLEPVHGTDTNVECLVKFEDLVLPQPAEDGTVDFHDRGRLPEISEGTALYIRHPGVVAVDGRDLAGRTIQARKGKDARLAAPAGCRLRSDCPDVAEAACDGYLYRGRDGRIHVGHVFQVKGDLDLSVGNIKYHGAVEIGGNVPSGFQIHAGGDVVIQGTAEGANISSQRGFIQIRGGVFGGELKAATDIHLGFAHEATIECGGTLEPGKYLQHCIVRCPILKFPRGGVLVGGETFVYKELEVEVLGTSAGTPTKVKLGVPEEEDAMAELEKMSIEERKLAPLREILEPKVLAIRQRVSSGGGLLGRARDDAQEALQQYAAITERFRQIEKRRAECNELLSADRVREGSVTVRRQIFMGTELHIFRKVVPIDQLSPPVRLSIKDDEIETRRA
ncbi:MAG: DUF342 domain-containing protein [Fibrobacteria bacterium]|nr:DUF342 domain-containing protein [Fibrobacteria bacterium]